MKKNLLISLAGGLLLIGNFVLENIKSKKEHDEIVNEAAELVFKRLSENEPKESE